MSSSYSVADLVPHSGTMSLLDRIAGNGDDWIAAEVDITPQTLFADKHGVPAWIGLEYMAQAVAAYAGLQERMNGSEPKIGLLLGSRKYITSSDYFSHGDTLLVRAKLDMQAANGLNVFECELNGKDVHAYATLNVYQPDNAEEFLKDSAK